MELHRNARQADGGVRFSCPAWVADLAHLGLVWLNIAAFCDGALHLPDSPTTCTIDNLFSETGQDDCVPTAAGLLDASLVLPATTALAAVDLSGLVRIGGNVLVSCTAQTDAPPLYTAWLHACRLRSAHAGCTLTCRIAAKLVPHQRDNRNHRLSGSRERRRQPDIAHIQH